MEESNRLGRSEVWYKIHDIVKQIPRKEVNCDAVDASSAATTIEELFLKLLPLVSQQRELLLQAYKDGFQAAVDSLVGANEAVKNKTLQ